jgi:hypothetical protein
VGSVNCFESKQSILWIKAFDPQNLERIPFWSWIKTADAMLWNEVFSLYCSYLLTTLNFGIFLFCFGKEKFLIFYWKWNGGYTDTGILDVKSLKVAGTFHSWSTVARALATKALMTYKFDRKNKTFRIEYLWA